MLISDCTCEDRPCCTHGDIDPYYMRDEADIQDELWERGYYDEPDEVDPADCDHGDWDGKDRWTVECIHCESKGLRIVNTFNGWQWDEGVEDVVLWL